jgi:hypothetical protein
MAAVKQKSTPSETHLSRSLKHEAQLACCRFSPCGKFVVAGSFDGSLLRWELAKEDGEKDNKTVIAGHHGWLTTLAFHSDKKRLYTADSWGKLCCWSYAEATPKLLWSNDAAHDGWIRTLAVSPDGKLLATAGNDRVVRLWPAGGGKPLREMPGHERHVYSLAFAPDGKSLVSGDLLGRVLHWNTANGKLVRELDAKPLSNRVKIVDGGGVRNMAFSGDGKHLACSGITDFGTSVVKGFPGVVLLDWKSGKQARLLRPKDYETEYKTKGVFVEGLRFHADGFLIGAGGNGEREGALWFWDPAKVDPSFQINPLPGSRDLDIHPNGRQLALVHFTANGRGKNGGNGRKATPEEYRCHHGVVALYEMAPKPQPAKKK